MDEKEIIFGEETEVEYLSEDEIALMTAPIVNSYYIYFDDQGTIFSITNEKKSEDLVNFIEVEYKKVEDFLTGKELTKNFKVSLIDKDTKLLIKKTEDAGKYTNLLINVDNIKTDNTTCVVEWNKDKQLWKFYIPSEFKNQFKEMGITTQLLFFITLKNNASFLVNLINIPMQDLINNQTVEIPWKSKYEKDFSNILVSTKRFFDSYGIQVYE